MKYRVNISREVHRAIDAQIGYLLGQGAPRDRVDDWQIRLYDLMDSLAEMPRRFPVAELPSEELGYEVRRVNLEDYALFYRVDDAGGEVEFVVFRHGRRRPWLETDD